MRSWNSRIPEEYLVCYQTSQRNWVIIKMLYKYLRRCLLSWHRSRLGFVTPSIGEVSLGPLGNTHHKKFASKVTKELVTRWCITERVKRLSGNEIKLVMWYVHFASCFYIDIYCIMGCHYTLCHNTYAYSLLFYKVYMKRENAGS